MKQIKLTQGKFALVDDEDYEELSKHKWYALKGRYTFYAQRWRPALKGKQIPIIMHRLLMNAEKKCDMVDHRDGNGLNNQKENLRHCSNRENSRNRKIQANNTSGYKGVSWHKRDGKWNVNINVNQKKTHLGYFTCLIKAAKAYDAAAVKYYGEFAKLNFFEVKP